MLMVHYMKMHLRHIQSHWMSQDFLIREHKLCMVYSKFRSQLPIKLLVSK